jgi:hypothetical protein
VDEVIDAGEGQLFLGTSMHRVVEHLTGAIEISEESVANFERNLAARSKYCADRDIDYRHVIFPDKATALRSEFPYAVVRSFTDRYRSVFNSEVLDLEPVLSRPAAFLRTDTHLSFDGMVESTIAIAESLLEFDVDRAREDLYALRGPAMEYAGDLGRKLTPPRTETHYRISGRHARRFDNRIGANDGHCIVSFNLRPVDNLPRKRLLIFGDSFLELSLPLLAYFYSEIFWCRSRFFHREIVDMFQPDQLITESAERYFSSVRADDVAPRFLLYYGIRGLEHSDDVSFYRAANAVLNYGNRQYDDFVSSLRES